MITGIVVFICIIIGLGLIFLGYIIGVQHVTKDIAEASAEAMVDAGLDRKTIEKICDLTIEKVKIKLNKR